MEQIVNKPLAETFSWLHAGGTRISVEEEIKPVSYTFTAGEEHFLSLEDTENRQINIILEKGAVLHLCQVHRSSSAALLDLHVTCNEDAHFHWYRLILGGTCYDNCSVDLTGAKSTFHAEIGYRLAKSDRYDINCEAIHTGKTTESSIYASGSLSGTAHKLMRGTIDFRRGCAGAVGNESEDVLLIDETVENLSLPVILCAEEDVEGNHGASIGRPDEQVVYYMETRGLNPEQIIKMMAKAKLDAVIHKIPDKELRESLEKEESAQ